MDQLDQSILAKAFRGEFVPQDPNDEPAPALLKRIREQREAQDAAKKAGKKGTRRSTKKKADTEEQQSRDGTHLLDVLYHADRPLHVDDLQAASGFSSTEFYSRLKDAIASGIIKERVDNNERYLLSEK